MASFECGYCGQVASKPAGHVNRARAAGYRLFCSRLCSGLGRRKNKTLAQKKAEKREYDILYREKNKALLKAKKAAYFKRTYDPAKAAIERKRRMPAHVEYCRRPEYRRKKHAYDLKYNATRNYGEFAEAFRLTIDLNREIKERMTNEQISQANGNFGKVQARRRQGNSEADRHGHRPAVGG